MKSITRFIKTGLLLFFPVLLMLITEPAFAELPKSKLKMFSQNNILFYEPGDCIDGPRGGSGSFMSTICGSTPKEKYWSALRQVFDEEHAAAVLGNINHEGGFGPTRWEIGVLVSGDGGHFIRDWNTLYNCTPGNCPGGVGAFGITWTLGPYLQYINGNDSGLLHYFQTPEEYSYAGDIAIQKIGEADFDRLVELEVRYVLNEANIEAFKRTTSLQEATDWWTMNYENCVGCCGSADRDHSCESVQPRRNSAQKLDDEFKDYNCGGSSSSEGGSEGETGAGGFGSGDGSNVSFDTSSSSSGPSLTGAEITFIGDSIAVQSEQQLEAKFPSSFINKVGSRHPTSGGVCPGDEGGLAILEKLVSGSGVIMNQHSNGSCEQVQISSNSLKSNIVWELGTNSGGATEETINRVIGLIGNRRLYLVTPYNGYSMESADGIANMYREMAAKHDNVFVIDWNQAVRDNDSAYVTRADSMAVHPTGAGRDLLADLTAQGVSGSTSCSDRGGFVWYGQYEDEWKDYPFGSSTVGPSGCGPTSFAMMATSLLGQSITPDETARIAGDAGMYVPGSGSSHEITRVLSEHYGLEYQALTASSASEAVSLINQYLQDGWMIHTSGSGSAPFTSGGHYIGIRGIAEDGGWLLADSGHEESYSTRSWDPLSVVNAGMLLQNIKAIRASSSLASCYNATSSSRLCTTSNSGGSGYSGGGATGTDGYQSKGDAQGIIEAYKNFDLSVFSLAMPDTGDYHDNCVAFSLWFINYYTQISYDPGRTGNGNEFVNVFYSHNKSKYPDMHIDSTPSVYALASWSVPTLGTSSGNHTGIVVGIDEERGKILIAEAGWNHPNFTGIHEYNLSDATGPSGYQYINLNNYLKPNTGLQ